MVGKLPPLSLYIHIPWCEKKCPYCDFNSHELTQQLPEKEYLAALKQDLAFERQRVGKRPLVSLFIGGGTPSLVSVSFIEQLLQTVEEQFCLVGEVEITLEANPGSTEVNKLVGFRAAGINRVSLGIQSFDDHSLQRIGRIHNGAEARRAIEAVQQAGLERYNVDLMFGLPDQTVAGGLRDLTEALDFGVTHLSWYQLTLEPNTRFAHFPPQLATEDDIFQLHDEGQQQLAQRGLQQYEISAYSQPGQQSRHNLNYWRFGDYLGVGAGAHGKLTDELTGRVSRSWKWKHPRQYMEQVKNGTPCQGAGQVMAEQLPSEYMINRLRLNVGFTADEYQQATGLPLSTIAEPIAEATRRGLLHLLGNVFQPTELGQRFLNDLISLFLDDEA